VRSIAFTVDIVPRGKGTDRSRTNRNVIGARGGLLVCHLYYREKPPRGGGKRPNASIRNAWPTVKKKKRQAIWQERKSEEGGETTET